MPLPRHRQSAADSSRPLRGIGRGVLILLLLGAATLAALGMLGDLGQIRRLVRGFSFSTLAIVLLLSTANYALRFMRWQVCLRQLDVRLPWSRSLAVFLAGFLLAVTPGKAGELAKAWLVREFGGGSARPVVAVVVTERLLDVLAVLLLLSSSALVFTGQRSFVAPIGLAAAAAVAAVGCSPLARRLASLLAKTRFGRGGADVLVDIHQAFTGLLKPGMLAFGLTLSTAAWAAEGIGCALVVRHYAPSAPVLASVFDYAASSLAGAASMLPGGLLAAEGSLVLLLQGQGVDLDAAMASTVIVRAVTLWFAVAVGLLTMPWVLSLLRRHRAVRGQENGRTSAGDR